MTPGIAAPEGVRATVVRLADVDLFLQEIAAVEGVERLRRLGFTTTATAWIERERERLLQGLERRWTMAYERARGRYELPIAVVRERVCSGCRVLMPSVARPRPDGDGLQVCQSCGRLLHWL